MEFLLSPLSKFAPHLLILAFLTITFLQSGLDKLTDWQGNLSFLKDHFSKTIFKNYVTILLGIIMLSEIIVGILCIVAIIQIYFYDATSIGFYTTILAAKILLALLLGQRIANDYAGAMTIAVYFIITVFGVFLMSPELG